MNTTDTKLYQLVQGAINRQIHEETVKLIAQAKIDLEKKIPEIVASVLIDVMQTPQVESIKDLIQFRIVSVQSVPFKNNEMTQSDIVDQE